MKVKMEKVALTSTLALVVGIHDFRNFSRTDDWIFMRFHTYNIIRLYYNSELMLVIRISPVSSYVPFFSKSFAI